MTLVLDIGPVASGIGIVAGLGFFLVFAGIAFLAFKMLKRTVKMAVRMAIVAAILLVAVVGSGYFFLFSGSQKPAPRPPQRTTPAR